MGMKPMAGLGLAFVALAGCQSSQPYMSNGSPYAAHQMPSNTTFAQGPGWQNQVPAMGTYSQSPAWQNQSRMMANNGSSGMMTATTMKADAAPIRTVSMTDATAGTAVVTPAGSAGNATAMVTISLPAMKVQVPVTGALAYTPPSSGAQTVSQTADAAGHDHVLHALPTRSMDHQIIQANHQSGMAGDAYVPQAGSSGVPSIQYVTPSAPYTSSGSRTPAAPAQPMSGGEEEGASSKPAAMDPPPPSWPQASSERNEGSTSELPPPPPARRPPSLYSTPTVNSGSNPYYQ